MSQNLKKFAQDARRSLISQVSSKLGFVLSEGSPARRENPAAVAELEKQIRRNGEETVVERIAYTWFNRFCALRFMDVNHFTMAGIVSPAEGQTQPEILADAKMGHVHEEMVPETQRQWIFSLLTGSISSPDPQGEAYRLLLVAACNYWSRFMPFMFQKILDYTELLMPDDLLSDNAILARIRAAMTPEACRDVEIIGWLYQYYISEKKDEIFAGLRKNRKISPENIPAATQLFTPHWIVKYLVENSLGRLWLLNRPESILADTMEYYVPPDPNYHARNVHSRKEDKNNLSDDFLAVSSPEEILVCDPACGSGHMLTYAFDLLYDIYEEEGYSPSEIPAKILQHNLYGIEIDERAAALAAFALTMKARQRHKRFFRKKIFPNICLLQPVIFEDSELKQYMDFVGVDLFTAPLIKTLHQFKEADHFGSLIRPRLGDAKEMRKMLRKKGVGQELFLSNTHRKVLKCLEMTEYLGKKYHVVVANPPYMGSRGMNDRLKVFAKKEYPISKSDLFAMFIERNLDMAQLKGLVAMITMQSWMFLSSFEKLRNKILNTATIISMAHLGPRAFDSIGGEVVSTTAFVLENFHRPIYKGAFVRLVDGKTEAEKDSMLKEALRQS